MAQTVSQEEAVSKALQFMRQGQQRAQAINADQLSMAYKAQSGDETYFYVFNCGQNDGYVIVGGDKAAREILGYGETGHFDYNSLPPQMKWWLGQYEGQISQVIKQVKSGNVVLGTQPSQNRAKASKSNISPLLGAIEWDQGEPYNSQIPNLSGFTGHNAFVTGCVATAAAQIMKYYEWPVQGEGNYNYQINYGGHGTVTFSADFANTTYDWANMLDSYSDSYTGEQASAVGTLMYHVGVAAKMSYNNSASGGSGANNVDLGHGLTSYLRYNKGMLRMERDYFTDNDWEDLVYSELANEHPVIYGGDALGGGGGHEFVCDGYQDGRYHINWGWGGAYNDYFLLTATAEEQALRPLGTGIGGGVEGSSYAGGQDILIGFVPDKTGTSKYAKLIKCTEYDLSVSSASIGSAFSIDGYMLNGGLVSSSFSFAAKLVNTTDDTDVVFASSSSNLTINPLSARKPVHCIVPVDATVGATYKVYPLYMDENGDWQEVQLKPGISIPEITVAAPTNIILSEPLSFSNDGYLSQKHWTISFSLKNLTDAQLTRDLMIWIYSAETGNSVAYYEISSTTFEIGEQKDYCYSFNDLTYGGDELIAAKDYWIRIKANSVNLSDLLTFHFVNDQSIPYTLTDAAWGTLCLPYEAEVPSGLTAYSITGVSGSALVKTEVAKFEMNKPYLVTGTPGNYNFEGPATPAMENLDNGLLIGNTTTAQTFAPAGSYVLQNIPAQSGLAFYEVANNNEQMVRQFGAYLDGSSLSSLASALTFTDGELFIDELDADENESVAPAYNLHGQRVEGQSKGLVIKNGKLNFFK